MSDDSHALSPISFTFEYAGHGWARASISDGVTTYYMDPSYVPADPLFGLIAAVVEVLTHGGEAGCTWNYEGAADRWTLRRVEDALRIAIRRLREGFSRPDWPTDERGDVCFSMTSDLWKFAAKVRLAVSRLEPAGEDHHDSTWVQRTPEYRALCAFLEEHKRTQRPPSAKSKRR